MKGLSVLKFWLETFQRELNSRQIKAINSIAFVTYRCTSRCSTCNIWKWASGKHKKFQREELITEKWSQMVEKLGKYGVKSLEIFGGDALLRKEVVYTILEDCKQLGMETFFPTNSNLLDWETAQELVSRGLDTIYFSIDGIDDLHDHIRGVKGTYNRAKQAILNTYEARSQLSKSAPRIGTITTVSNMNVNKLEEIVSELRNYPIDFALIQAMGEIASEDIENSTIEHVKPTPYFVSNSEESHLLSHEQVRILRSTLRKLKKDNSLPFYLGLSHIEPLPATTFTSGLFPGFPCHICTTVVTVTPSGDVLPCPYFKEFPIGNLCNGASLHHIWGNEKHRHFITVQRRGSLAVCRKCSMRHFYPGLLESFKQTFLSYLYVHLLGR